VSEWIVNAISVHNSSNYKLERHFASYACLFHQEGVTWAAVTRSVQIRFTASNNMTSFVTNLLEPMTSRIPVAHPPPGTPLNFKVRDSFSQQVFTFTVSQRAGKRTLFFLIAYDWLHTILVYHWLNSI